ncbi:MAG TPA: UDP-N-acetylmuramoyl-L-alanine--D-glutamate ligase [Kiritimatiellia bacterium]|nr:UDP-N-acetylmuramoyl-L-alanine--D-glutamate ligase [Kiritimatiellia bacterium]
MNSPNHALVLGLGASGVAAARLLCREGRSVVAIDRTPRNLLSASALALEGEGVELLTESTDLPSLDRFNLAVASPGLPVDSPWLNACRRAGLPVRSEVELGWSRHPGRSIAVTGTNGKSTIVKLIADWLSSLGYAAIPCGNYGLPVCEAVCPIDPHRLLVIEVSSFQLETCESFSPDVAIWLNLSPNHLDRHATLEAYRRAKARLFRSLRPHAHAIVHHHVLSDVRRVLPAPVRLHAFGEAGPPLDFAFRDGVIEHRDQPLADFRKSSFEKAPIGVNAASVAALALLMDLPVASLEQAARSFQPLPHRYEVLGESNGLLFVNDSKASTFTATAAALARADRPVRLIAGGLLKEDDVDFIKEILAKTCAGVYVIGKCAETLNQAWRDVVRVRLSRSLDQAFDDAVGEARAGEIILLSPGCASFDQFRGYQHRGETFINKVRTYSGETSHAEKT